MNFFPFPPRSPFMSGPLNIPPLSFALGRLFMRVIYAYGFNLCNSPTQQLNNLWPMDRSVFECSKSVINSSLFLVDERIHLSNSLFKWSNIHRLAYVRTISANHTCTYSVSRCLSSAWEAQASRIFKHLGLCNALFFRVDILNICLFRKLVLKR